MEPFEIRIDEAVLTNRRQHALGHRFWQHQLAVWREHRLHRQLVEYWLTGYDWRERERAMNAFPQFRTQIDGVLVHSAHLHRLAPCGCEPPFFDDACTAYRKGLRLSVFVWLANGEEFPIEAVILQMPDGRRVLHSNRTQTKESVLNA